ncbi:MAG: V-type ATP synthase subunit F [Anaerofustis sp.]
MYKIAVMGDYDSIYGFAALGLEIFPVTDATEAGKLIRKLSEGQYAVIYITEALAAVASHELEKYKTEILPAIIPIPGATGNTGLGIANVKKFVEQAVGSDIIFNNEN